MKEKVLFIAALIGSFSATILLLINHALVLLEVDTTGYAGIINIVSIVLAILILLGATVFLNKYTTLQHKQTFTQNNLVATALDGNASLMSTMLPKLANQILVAADERSTSLLKTAEANLNTMMNEMLPALAEQTMKLVTEQSRDIVEKTTAKANETMKIMNDLIPTFAKNISDSVAQTVRENNAHYHKMLIELKELFANNNIPSTNTSSSVEVMKYPTVDEITTLLQENFNKIEHLVLANFQPVVDEQEQIIVKEPEDGEAQSDKLNEESDESITT